MTTHICCISLFIFLCVLFTVQEICVLSELLETERQLMSERNPSNPSHQAQLKLKMLTDSWIQKVTFLQIDQHTIPDLKNNSIMQYPEFRKRFLKISSRDFEFLAKFLNCKIIIEAQKMLKSLSLIFFVVGFARINHLILEAHRRYNLTICVVIQPSFRDQYCALGTLSVCVVAAWLKCWTHWVGKLKVAFCVYLNCRGR